MPGIIQNRRLLLPGSASGPVLLARTIYPDATGKLVLPTEGRTTTGYAKNSDGVYEAFGSGVPMVVGARKVGSDYYATDTEGAALSPAPYVLTTPGATNSCAYSQDLTGTGWTTTGLVKAQNAPDIFGNANSAWTIEDDNGSGFKTAQYQSSCPSDSNTNSVRFWVKKAVSPSNYPLIRLTHEGGTVTYADYVIDHENGTLTAVGQPGDNVSISSDGDFWKATISEANNGTNTSIKAVIYPAYNSNGSTTPSSTATGSIVIDQVEIFLNTAHAVAHALPPIPTNGSAVTTDPTEVSIDWPSGLVNDFLVVADLVDIKGGASYYLNNYTNGNNYWVLYEPGISKVTVNNRLSGVNNNVISGTTFSAGDSLLIRALQSSASGVRLFQNGTLVANNASVSGSISADATLEIGDGDNLSATTILKIRDIQIWSVPASISDAAVLDLTP